ncbi:MAG: M48 family metallopeptidase [Myxococcota bacterium]
MHTAPYPSLADFAETWSSRDAAANVDFAVGGSSMPALPEAVVTRLEEMLDTVVALQRAEWLEEGVYVGPRAMPEVYRAVMDASRRLEVALPPALVARVAMPVQGTYGTDGRAFLLLSSFFVKPASEGELQFMVGRQVGHMAAQQVTGRSLYALVVDHNGVRKLARRAVGPTLEVVLAPVSLGLRVALSRWHRLAELTADRAGLLVADDLEASRRALLRCALGTTPDVSVDDYLNGNRAAKDRGPGRWTELLSDRPWLHKRLGALSLWARSETFARLGGTVAEGVDLLDDEALDRETRALIAVGA